ncbi:MAG: transglutaminase-like domain-containing protein [Patescibacteria group bacterium]|jgi:hypothetical protein
MFERYRSHYPQSFHVNITVALFPNDKVIAIPYPINHPQQTVMDVNFSSDGNITDHGAVIIIEHGKTARIEATISVKPFKPIFPQADLAFQSAGGADHMYLEPDQFIHSKHPAILAEVKKINLKQRPLQILEHIYNHCLDQLQYGNPVPGLYTTTEALALDSVDCGGFSTYLAAMVQACGIPVRLVSGFWAGYKHNDMHAWIEALLPDGTWWPMDPSVEWLRLRRRSAKHGGFGQLGSDRIVINIGTNHVIKYQSKDYPVGMLQLPMILTTTGDTQYLQVETTITCTRL